MIFYAASWFRTFCGRFLNICTQKFTPIFLVFKLWNDVPYITVSTAVTNKSRPGLLTPSATYGIVLPIITSSECLCIIRAEHEIYIGNYPVKFREAELRNLFKEHGVEVKAIRMKHDGLKV